MKKFLVAFSAFIVLLGLSGAAGAYTIDYAYVNSANQFTSPYAGLPGYFTEDFNSAVTGGLAGPLNWTWTGDGRVLNGDISGQAAAPMGVNGTNRDATNYIAVPTNLTVPNFVTATNLGGTGGTYDYFGLWWGSVDYAGANDINNVLKFYLNGVLVQTITGADAINPGVPNGNQNAPGTNLYVNFYNLPLFDSFEMSSNRFAFEADNFTVGVVPEPGTLILLGSGLLGLVAAGRKKFRK